MELSVRNNVIPFMAESGCRQRQERHHEEQE